MSHRDQMTSDDQQTGYELGFYDGVEYFASVITTALCGSGDDRLADLGWRFNNQVAGCGDPIPEEIADSFCSALEEQGFTLPLGDIREVVWDWHGLKERLRRARADLEDAAPVAPDDPDFDENQARRYAEGTS